MDHFRPDSLHRSIVKALSWRILATLTTVSIAFVITVRVRLAVEIGLADMVLKICIYYLHERMWNRIPFGRVKPPEYTI